MPIPALAPVDNPPEDVDVGVELGEGVLVDDVAEAAVERTEVDPVVVAPVAEGVDDDDDDAVPVTTASPNFAAMVEACRLSMLQQSRSPPQHHLVEFEGLSVSHGVTCVNWLCIVSMANPLRFS